MIDKKEYLKFFEGDAKFQIKTPRGNDFNSYPENPVFCDAILEFVAKGNKGNENHRALSFLIKGNENRTWATFYDFNHKTATLQDNILTYQTNWQIKRIENE